MITGSFNGTEVRTVKSLLERGPRVIEAVISEMNTQSSRLAGYIVGSKLQGQVLGRGTGLLAGSVHANQTQLRGNSIVASVAAAGGLAWHGKVHEYGKTYAYDRRTKTGSVSIVAHYRERSFMRSSRDELRSSIVAEIQARALAEASR